MTSFLYRYCGENHEDNKIFNESYFPFNLGNGRNANTVRMGNTFCNKAARQSQSVGNGTVTTTDSFFDYTILYENISNKTVPRPAAFSMLEIAVLILFATHLLLSSVTPARTLMKLPSLLLCL